MLGITVGTSVDIKVGPNVGLKERDSLGTVDGVIVVLVGTKVGIVEGEILDDVTIIEVVGKLVGGTT